MAEGVKSKSDHVFFCRMTVARDSQERVDVKEGETLKDEATGKLYRVVFVSEEGGVGDHYKIYLLYQPPAGG